MKITFYISYDLCILRMHYVKEKNKTDFVTFPFLMARRSFSIMANTFGDNQEAKFAWSALHLICVEICKSLPGKNEILQD